MDRPKKEEVVSDIRETFQNVSSIVLADYRGINVPTVTAMREEFRENGCEYRVLKNTLVKLAIQDSDLEPMSSLLVGPTALMWSSESPSTPAKIALKFAKEHKAFEIKGGFFEGEVLDPAGVDRLAKMPSKEELQSQFLMTLLAAPQKMVRTLSAGPKNFLYLLQARERSLQGEDA